MGASLCADESRRFFAFTLERIACMAAVACTNFRIRVSSTTVSTYCLWYSFSTERAIVIDGSRSGTLKSIISSTGRTPTATAGSHHSAAPSGA